MGIGSFGGTELIIALVIILLLFGAKRIPELAKGLGSGVREFRKGTRGDYEVEEEREEAKKEELSSSEDKPETRPEDATAEADRAEQKPR
ncbi:MAG: twin-arginine translocase TatA/TatE family subunit [Actinomycetota bacterium]|jgi:sec-independent protein translocase protein TatA|nr:twin-arginine translocase TatA/TatE family subunit [Actinomycetota bacterium]